ncbi:MAG: ABC transporter permease subunit [Acidimicrobiia bacterium]|nr:ABC transporter permease subunit [Acidimicrobiia bacterium]
MCRWCGSYRDWSACWRRSASRSVVRCTRGERPERSPAPRVARCRSISTACSWRCGLASFCFFCSSQSPWWCDTRSTVDHRSPFGPDTPAPSGGANCSIVVPPSATVIAVVLGGLSGVALARRPGTWTKIFMATVFLILVTPEVMDAIALVTWFQRLQDVPVLGYVFKNGLGPFNGGMHKLWVGQSLYASAVVTLIVRARLSGLDESLEEAAADLGAPPARAFRQITLPLISSALIAGGLLSFTLCLDNAVISTLVSEAGSTTFPVALLGATKSTIKPFWGVGAVMLFMITMAALAFVAVVLRRSGESSSDIAATLAGG